MLSHFKSYYIQIKEVKAFMEPEICGWIAGDRKMRASCIKYPFLILNNIGMAQYYVLKSCLSAEAVKQIAVFQPIQ